jgi:CRP-like cAMP-binding protein
MHGADGGTGFGSALQSVRRSTPTRKLKYAAGGVTGDLEFFLQRTRTFGAQCVSDAEVVRLRMADYGRLLAEEPLVAVMLQHVIVQNEMQSTASTLLAMHQGSAAPLA